MSESMTVEEVVRTRAALLKTLSEPQDFERHLESIRVYVRLPNYPAYTGGYGGVTRAFDIDLDFNKAVCVETCDVIDLRA